MLGLKSNCQDRIAKVDRTRFSRIRELCTFLEYCTVLLVCRPKLCWLKKSRLENRIGASTGCLATPIKSVL